MWKPEHARNRKRKAESDPEYRAKRNAQGNGKDREKHAAYMREYYRNNRDKWKRTQEQQDAINDQRKKRYAEDPEFREQCKAASRKRDPEAKRDARLREQFGITSADYDEILQRQDGCCAICRLPNYDQSGRRMHVDHCHETGKVRGILCSSCNTALGKFKDNTNYLERAIEYLLESRQ